MGRPGGKQLRVSTEPCPASSSTAPAPALCRDVRPGRKGAPDAHSARHPADANFKARIVHVNEERAELAKHHLDVLWHDYFKTEHLQQYPNLHETFWTATKQASTVRHSLDLDAAREVLSMIDTIDEMWKGTGGPEKTRVNGRPR